MFAEEDDESLIVLKNEEIHFIISVLLSSQNKATIILNSDLSQVDDFAFAVEPTNSFFHSQLFFRIIHKSLHLTDAKPDWSPSQKKREIQDHIKTLAKDKCGLNGSQQLTQGFGAQASILIETLLSEVIRFHPTVSPKPTEVSVSAPVFVFEDEDDGTFDEPTDDQQQKKVQPAQSMIKIASALPGDFDKISIQLPISVKGFNLGPKERLLSLKKGMDDVGPSLFFKFQTLRQQLSDALQMIHTAEFKLQSTYAHHVEKYGELSTHLSELKRRDKFLTSNLEKLNSEMSSLNREADNMQSKVQRRYSQVHHSDSLLQTRVMLATLEEEINSMKMQIGAGLGQIFKVGNKNLEY